MDTLRCRIHYRTSACQGQGATGLIDGTACPCCFRQIDGASVGQQYSAIADKERPTMGSCGTIDDRTVVCYSQAAACQVEDRARHK
eukprot:3391093-Prymnesium_polylepis.1